VSRLRVSEGKIPTTYITLRMSSTIVCVRVRSDVGIDVTEPKHAPPLTRTRAHTDTRRCLHTPMSSRIERVGECMRDGYDELK